MSPMDAVKRIVGQSAVVLPGADGADVRWLVVEGDLVLFAKRGTKRIRQVVVTGEELAAVHNVYDVARGALERCRSLLAELEERPYHLRYRPGRTRVRLGRPKPTTERA